MSDSNDQLSQQSNSPGQINQGGFTVELNTRQILFLALSLIGLVLLCVFGFLLIDPLGLINDSEGEVTSNEDGDTALDDAASTPTPSLQTDDVIVVFDGANTLSIDLDPPVSLAVKNEQFQVNSEFVSADEPWANPDLSQGAVEWVFGSIINQVYGLAPTEEIEILMEQLVPGDRIAIRYQSGTTREFVVTGRELTTIGNADLFIQDRPGIKLVWLGDKPTGRLVISGDFLLPDAVESSADAVTSASIGETVQLSDVQISVSDTQVLVDDPTIPPGFSLFVVNYEIENVGSQVVDTGLWRFVLADESGTQYSLNLAASQLANAPLLSGSLGSGESRLASAAYQIPVTLNSRSLEWRVSRVDGPGQINVAIPFNQSDGNDVAIAIERAEISLDGTSLLIGGSLTNNSQFPIVVTENNISLVGNGTNYLVFSTTPAFPWTIAGGQAAPFSLSFQRPQTSDVNFTLLDQTFQLTEIR
ncbi:MAG: DUF4352 domain-containing protein [Chloroflexota bacterium]